MENASRETAKIHDESFVDTPQTNGRAPNQKRTKIR